MKKKIFIALLVGIMIGVSTTTYATYKYQATEVGYTPSNSEFKVDNVESAINELYLKIENNNSSTSKNLLGNIEKSDNFLATGYYKSTAADNNIIFGGYCWKIIRKTDDDDIRILYNGLPTDGECTKTGEDTQIGTSKYSETYDIVAYNESTIKSVVDNWSNTNLAAKYTDMISNIDLITREEATTVGAGYIVSGQSYWTKTPAGGSITITSSCSISTDSGKGCSESTSGNVSSSTIYVINTDGNVVANNNGTYYGGPFSGTCRYCTRTEWSYGQSGCNDTYVAKYACCNYKDYTGSCFATDNGDSLGVRPVITLKNTVEIQGGVGTTNDPYYVN